ncbi:MAG: hypothetical protein ACQXXF_07645 [Thermoplasmatota archaeon]|jgi:hypothetical protein
MTKIKKTITSVVVIILFLGLSFSSIAIAEPIDVKNKKMTVLIMGINNNDYKIEIVIDEEDIKEINNKIQNLIELINLTMNINSEQGIYISNNEWNLLKNAINNLIDIIAKTIGEDFPKEDIKIFIDYLIERLINPINLFKQPIISTGIGITFIPFYDYETFFGKLIRPVIIQHLIGFSATVRLNPFIVGFPFIKFGFHRIRTFFFDGLMINFADLGINKIVGPQLLLGFGCFTGFA